jgi:hypothetical protein
MRGWLPSSAVLITVHHGFVDLEPEIAGSEAPKPAPGSTAAPRLVKKELNNNDPLFAQIRNLNFGELGPLLNRLARHVSEGYEERHQAQTVSQIKDFMKKLSKLQASHKVCVVCRACVCACANACACVRACVRACVQACTPVHAVRGRFGGVASLTAFSALACASRSPRTSRWPSAFKRSRARLASISGSSASRRRCRLQPSPRTPRCVSCSPPPLQRTVRRRAAPCGTVRPSRRCTRVSCVRLRASSRRLTSWQAPRLFASPRVFA